MEGPLRESSNASMEHVLHLSGKSTLNNKLKICCSKRLPYHTRRLRNKGAILIVILNFLIASVFYYLTAVHTHKLNENIMLWSLTLPIAGCLADVFFRRYRMIQWSTFMMWVAAMLLAVTNVIEHMVASYHHINVIMTEVLVGILSLGFGGFQANVILFGIDQLQDASTDEITSFITWFVWTYFSGELAISFAYTCLEPLFELLVVCVSLSIAMCSLFLFNNILIKEPVVKENPFRKIYKIVKYAIKTKHPRCRSAFTYCEDELPSRIDFGKSKYGGPFTTEQVEDVKTFFRLLVIIFVGFGVPCGIFPVEIVSRAFWKQFISIDHETHTAGQWLQKCIKKKLSTNFLFFSGTLLIPLYEFVLYPLLYKRLYWVKSYWKFLLGALLQMARIIVLMAFEVNFRYSYLQHHGDNATLLCVFKFDDIKGTLEPTFNILWTILPDFLNSLSVIMFVIGGIELICSQSPYSLRGLLFGAGYGSLLIFNWIGFFVLKPFRKFKSTRIWGTGVFSCGFWYLLTMLLLLILACVVFCIAIKWYRKRKREDVLPNEQVFAERYYDNSYRS